METTQDGGASESRDSAAEAAKADTGSESTAGQTVVKEQVKAVVGDLENVLGELKTVVGDLRVLVNQIDVVTSKIDEEYGAETTRSLECRRRSASLFEMAAPSKDRDSLVPHSVSQPFDILRPCKDFSFQVPADFVTKSSDSPRHSNSNSTVIRRRAESSICQEHSMEGSGKADVTLFRSNMKDDIIVCTPGSMCHKKDIMINTANGMANRRNNDVALSGNVPTANSRTPSDSHSSRSPRTSKGSQAQSHRTSDSSGIGNSNISGNGNNSVRDKHRHSHNSKPNRTKRNSLCVDDRHIFSDDYHKEHNFCKTEQRLHYTKGTIVDDRGNMLNLQHAHCSPCSPSPDSDYCGVYERELDLKLELVFDDGLDRYDDAHRTLDLGPYPGYGSTFDRERVSRWAAYTVVNVDRLPVSSDDQFTETQSETSSDILNDNVFVSTPSRDDYSATQWDDYSAPWDSLFDRDFGRRLDNTDIG